MRNQADVLNDKVNAVALHIVEQGRLSTGSHEETEKLAQRFDDLDAEFNAIAFARTQKVPATPAPEQVVEITDAGQVVTNEANPNA